MLYFNIYTYLLFDKKILTKYWVQLLLIKYITQSTIMLLELLENIKQKAHNDKTNRKNAEFNNNK